MPFWEVKTVLLPAFVTFVVLQSFSLMVKGARVNTVETLADRTVALPCVATRHPVGDTPNLLLFYRKPSNIPFFSYDARSGDFWREGSSKTRDSRYEGRVYLNLTQPRRVHLNLERVTIEDAGDFTCRVDFISSPSLTSKVKLKVFADPKIGPTVRIGMGPGGTLVDGKEVGPYYEGENLNLSCTVTGGFPIPKVTWWQNVKLLDNTSYAISSSSSSGPRKIVNDLTIGPLTRKLVSQPFTCRSENNPISSPIDRTIHIKIHMAPQSVIIGDSTTVRSGIEERLECRAKGAYPAANVTWFLSGRPLNFTAKETRQIESDTVSWVRFIASPKEDGATLTCVGSSPTLPDPPVSVNVTLNVTYKPQVHLQFGTSLTPDRIRQGDDVYFDCHTEANPPVNRIRWFKEAKEVRHNKMSGVIVGGNNLVLQGVQRPDSGSYTCRATNPIGTTSSNPLPLSILYGPICNQGRLTVTALEGEVVTLKCQVDAYPSDVSFSWVFNNTVDSSQFRDSEYTVNGLESILRYVAYSSRDYGTVFCWASNLVGRQDEPCAFTLQPAGTPDSVRDCVLTNQSAGSLHITCKPGADGGLTQTFRAAVYVADSQDPLRVVEGMSPVFTVEGLAPAEDYIIRVTAINRKGTSPPVSLEAFTLKVAENRMISGVLSTQPEPEDVPEGAVSPLLGVILGIVGALLLLGTAAVFVTRRHCTRASARTPDLVAGQELEIKEGTTGVTVGPGSCSGGEMEHRDHDVLDTPDLTDSHPLLGASECSSGGTASTPASAGGGGGSVFTIPTHIPPPPQYCSQSSIPVTTSQSDLLPTQSPFHHTISSTSQSMQQQQQQQQKHHQQQQQQADFAGQSMLIHQTQMVSQLSLHSSSSPRQYRLQRSTSVDQCAGQGVGSQHSSPPTNWIGQHGTPATFAIKQPGHSNLGVIYSISTDENLHQQHRYQQQQQHSALTAESVGSGCAHPSAIHYVQPMPGVDVSRSGSTSALGMGNPMDILCAEVKQQGLHYSGTPHTTTGQEASHLLGISEGDAVRPEVGIVPEQGVQRVCEPQVAHASPKVKGKHVTWSCKPTHGEESAV